MFFFCQKRWHYEKNMKRSKVDDQKNVMSGACSLWSVFLFLFFFDKWQSTLRVAQMHTQEHNDKVCCTFLLVIISWTTKDTKGTIIFSSICCVPFCHWKITKWSVMFYKCLNCLFDTWCSFLRKTWRNLQNLCSGLSSDIKIFRIASKLLKFMIN